MISNPAPAGVDPPASTPTSASVVSGRTLDSRVSKMEEQMSVMEKNITQSMASTMETMFLKFGATLQTNTQPPAGASGGGSND